MKIFIQSLTGKTTEHLVKQGDYLIHKKVVNDFFSLKKAAEQQGFILSIASSFRDFDRQLAIWNKKFTGQLPLLDSQCKLLDALTLREDQKIIAILRWSALPGASRHHWGTDLDIYASNLLPTDSNLKLEPWEYFTGHQLPFYTWLKTHSQNFGFFFPYAEDKGGVAVEPWHISHQECAKIYQEQLSVEILQHSIQEADILGKESILAMLPDIYLRFITNISPPY